MAKKTASWSYILSSVAVLGAGVLLATTSTSLSKERVGRAVLRRQTVAPPPIIPIQPAAYPSADESLMITGAFLTDPIVTSALAYVQSIVPTAMLNIPPAAYVSGSKVNYTANPIATCYWPVGLCTRTTVGDWGAPDIVYCPQDYQWGLTFDLPVLRIQYDDAPSEKKVNGSHYNDTIALMDQLDSMNIKATFFVTGSQSIYFPTSVAAIATRQHHVAHHTWSHHPLTSLTNEQVVAEMMYTAATIFKNTGLSVRYFRPAYGDIDDRVRAIANALGFRVVLWDDNYDSVDAVSSSAVNYGKVQTKIASWFNTAKGFISLQHTINPFTSGTSIAALKTIQSLGGIKNRMMPVPQCLGDIQWYKNAQVTTIFNSCTMPGGYCDNVPSPTVSSVASSTTTTVINTSPSQASSVAPSADPSSSAMSQAAVTSSVVPSAIPSASSTQASSVVPSSDPSTTTSSALSQSTVISPISTVTTTTTIYVISPAVTQSVVPAAPASPSSTPQTQIGETTSALSTSGSLSVALGRVAAFFVVPLLVVGALGTAGASNRSQGLPDSPQWNFYADFAPAEETTLKSQRSQSIACKQRGRSVLKRQVAPPPAIPLQPVAYPSADENLMISGAFLTDPIVTSSLAYVQSVVPAATLNITPATYVSGSKATYHADPVATCYWPSNLCTRTTTGDWGAPDIVYCPKNYQWGLTYDDAPSEKKVNGSHYNDTIALMDQLDSMKIKATFFVTGSQSVYYPDSLAAIATRQHHVAHHTWSHHPMTSLTNEQASDLLKVVAEMMYTAAIIHKNTGLSVRYFRPSYGDIDDRVRAIVNALGFRIVLWDNKYDSTDADVGATAANFGKCLGDVQWYKNTQVTTIFNSCTVPGGDCDDEPSATISSVHSTKSPSKSATAALPTASPHVVSILSSGAVLVGTVLFATSLESTSERFGRSVIERRQLSAPPAIPLQPTAYPSADETLFISGTYLNDPIVTSALAYVNSVVPASLLNLAPSTYIQYSDVTYHADPTTSCYWPNNLCTRTTDGPWGAADIIYCPQNYQWGLTYDDAPSDNIVKTVHTNDTVAIMDQLDAMNIKATFFVTGSQSTYYPASLVAIANRNHHVAHHTWSHHPLTSLTNAQIVAEMMYTAAIIHKNTGLSVRYFRPPYGDMDDRVRAIVNALGFRIVIWDGKYDATDADVTANAANYGVVENIISSWFNTAPGFISLQHTISTFTSGTSIAALKKIQSLGGIKNQMMPVPQCLGDTQWYKNAQVTTVWNSCTIPGGCGAVVASPAASPVQASPVVPSPVQASPVVPSPVQPSPIVPSPVASTAQSPTAQLSSVVGPTSISSVTNTTPSSSQTIMPSVMASVAPSVAASSAPSNSAVVSSGAATASDTPQIGGNALSTSGSVGKTFGRVETVLMVPLLVIAGSLVC
ncbi:hypothetical protein SmJEL517_g00104 [Synchytrium microbalum]|uniref:NodB homology domain-containing protein n=1 Tax=Synchytrium microbalum TaxID=1806994 RepID=A0A507CIP8_9FUNG|nr:uncharacterized protein SmJEL517_g00104 [Synchytrium microbalum]TPX38106.1 hypothetical protein SmJEL517_g00104 [Synchytrium microbalum]